MINCKHYKNRFCSIPSPRSNSTGVPGVALCRASCNKCCMENCFKKGAELYLCPRKNDMDNLEKVIFNHDIKGKTNEV
jgi:flavoprotein